MHSLGCEGKSSENIEMGLRALPLSPSQNGLRTAHNKYPQSHNSYCRSSRVAVICAKKENGEEEAKPTTRKQNLFESVTEALDFSQVRSARDAELLEDARQATRSGDKMSREQVSDLSFIFTN